MPARRAERRRRRGPYDKFGDSATSVANGLAAMARVITAVAAIHGGRVRLVRVRRRPDRELFGIGLALAVLLDATVVRMLLVQATIALIADKDWWMPAWLDRIIPS